MLPKVASVQGSALPHRVPSHPPRRRSQRQSSGSASSARHRWLSTRLDALDHVGDMAADFKTAPEAAAALRQVSEAMAVRIPPCSRMAACPGKGPQDCTKGSQTSSHYSKKGRGGGGFNLVLSSSASAGSDRPSGVRVQGALASATAPVGVPSSASEARSLLEKASVMMMSVSPDTTGARTFSTAEAAHASIAHLGSAAAHMASPLVTSPDTFLVTSVFFGVAGCASLIGLRSSNDAGDHAADLPSLYNPQELQQYWQTRPVKVSSRAATLAFEFARFAVRLRKDELLGQVDAKRPKRAKQLRELVQKLGPTFIKLAQAFSTRADLLPPDYIKEIEKLQDSVQPFPCEVARAIVAQELGCDPSVVFEDISGAPVAAASLGQVYKAKLSAAYGGADVAVKVQRPGVLETVAIDLYILRSIAEILQDMTSIAGRTDFMALVDDWGIRFFAEMSFQAEALNAGKFRRQMQERGLGGVVVPGTYWELSSNMLLVTEWVDGQKLSESTRQDVRALCSTLLNCYLIQLLDTGFLHADPHPGNLIVTRDGNLCLLDWGLITEVDAETRVTLVEFIAHLQTEDWDRVGDDLMALGFVSPEGGSPREQGLIEPLGNILGQLTVTRADGCVSIEKVTRDLDDLSRKFPYFMIPPYFALILRAFSVIEGIALAVDPGYGIVRECMPYVAQRVLSDDTPRMRALLRQLLYGNGTRLDMARLQKLSDGFVGFKTNGISRRSESLAPRNAIRRSGFEESLVDERVKQGLRIVLRAGGSFSQEIIINELVNAVDALGREALVELANILARGIPGARGGLLGGLSPLSAILVPVQNPLARVQLSEEDKEALATVRAIMALFEEEGGAVHSIGQKGATNWDQELLPRLLQDPRLSIRSSLAMGQELLPLFGEIAPGLANVWSSVAIRLLQRAVARLLEPVG